MENLYSDGEDLVCRTFLDLYCQMIEDWQTASAKLSISTADRPTALTAWLDTTDNADVTRLREQIVKINSRLAAIAEENVPDNRPPEEEINKQRLAVTELGNQIRISRDAIVVMAKRSTDSEKVLSAFEKMQEQSPVSRTGRGRPAGQAGSNLPRVSANVYLLAETSPEGADAEHHETFTAAASRLGMQTEDFGKEYAVAAGVAYEEISKVKDTLEFFVIPPGSKVKWSVRVEPKERGKSPGRPPGSKNKAA